MVRLIDADDERNPSYYEPRAGYPLPDVRFYEGRTNKKAKRTKVTFTEENFVRGFDLKCGEFYRFREAIIPLLISGKLYKKNFEEADVKWDLYDVYDKAEKHDIIKDKTGIPIYWKRKMIQKFVTSLSHWLSKHNGLIDHVNKAMLLLPRTANWRWGPHRYHRKFDGYYQYQHLTIQIKHSVSSEPLQEVSVRDIADQEILDPIGCNDMSLKKLRFEMLEDRIKEIPALHGYSADTHIIRYQHPDEDNVTVRMYDDSSLASALTALRKKMSFVVQIEVVEPVGSVHSKAPMPVALITQRKRSRTAGNEQAQQKRVRMKIVDI